MTPKRWFIEARDERFVISGAATALQAAIQCAREFDLDEGAVTVSELLPGIDVVVRRTISAECK